VLFAQGSAELTDEARTQLAALARRLAEDESIRVQLLAYAKDTGGGTSRARRLSLSRALAVRSFLIERGIRSTRMDVRALGDKAADGPPDRVDILPRRAQL
ncbi:MAG: OmpA family protein, partial [Alphaproteobacteria bacterium]